MFEALNYCDNLQQTIESRPQGRDFIYAQAAAVPDHAVEKTAIVPRVSKRRPPLETHHASGMLDVRLMKYHTPTYMIHLHLSIQFVYQVTINIMTSHLTCQCLHFSIFDISYLVRMEIPPSTLHALYTYIDKVKIHKFNHAAIFRLTCSKSFQLYGRTCVGTMEDNFMPTYKTTSVSELPYKDRKLHLHKQHEPMEIPTPEIKPIPGYTGHQVIPLLS